MGVRAASAGGWHYQLSVLLVAFTSGQSEHLMVASMNLVDRVKKKRTAQSSFLDLAQHFHTEHDTRKNIDSRTSTAVPITTSATAVSRTRNQTIPSATGQSNCGA